MKSKHTGKNKYDKRISNSTKKYVEQSKKQNPFFTNRYEIIYNLIGSSFTGILILLGAFTSGEITPLSIFIALCLSFSAFIVKFNNYWESQREEYKAKSSMDFPNKMLLVCLVCSPFYWCKLT